MTEEKFSDVVLVTKDGTRIPAHRVILVRCLYFRAMFCGGMKEARESEVKLEVEEDVLRVILGYIYTGNVELGLLDVKLFFQILENARMMCFKDLEDSVRNHIMKIIQTDDIESNIEIFNEAVETKFQDILSKSLYFLPQPRYLYCHQAVSLLSVGCSSRHPGVIRHEGLGSQDIRLLVESEAVARPG